MIDTVTDELDHDDPAPGSEPDRVIMGRRIRALRLERGLSLRAVADAIGVSSSALSQIENGVMQPSVKRLIGIMDVIGAPLSAVFTPARVDATGHDALEQGSVEALPGVSVARGADAPVLDLSEGVRYVKVTPVALEGIDYFESHYAPGSASSEVGEFLVHHGVEFGRVVRGRLIFEFEMGRVELGEGDSIAFHASLPHRVVNESSAIAQAIWLTVRRDV